MNTCREKPFAVALPSQNRADSRELFADGQRVTCLRAERRQVNRDPAREKSILHGHLWESPAADLATARQVGYGRRKEELEDAEEAAKHCPKPVLPPTERK